MKRIVSLVAVAAVTVGVGVAVLASSASAAPAPATVAPAVVHSDGSGAAESLNKMMRSASVPSAAASPGGAVLPMPATPMPAPSPATGAPTPNTVGAASAPTVRTTSCAGLAAKLKAGLIKTYSCTSASAFKVPAGETPQMSAAAVAFPSACSTGTGTLVGWTAVSRRAACDHTQIGLVTTQQPSGKVVGTTNLHAVNTMVAPTTSARWSLTTDLWVFGATGVGLPSSARATMFPNGCSGCIGTGATWTTRPDLESWHGTENLDVTGLAGGVIRPGVGGSWEATLNGTGWGNSVVITYAAAATSRCDNAVSKRVPGCVLPTVAGVAGFSQAKVPQFVRHVYGAQLSGLPGRYGTTTVLTKIASTALATKNGDRACPTSLSAIRPGPGDVWHCDEYPFRSTYQGTYTSGSTVARSQSWCQMRDPARTGPTGWSRCFIDATQNLSAGGTLGVFYADQRMLDKDPFQVGYLA